MDVSAFLLEQISGAVDSALLSMSSEEKGELDSVVLVCVRKGGQSGLVKVFHDPDSLPKADTGKNLIAIHSIHYAVDIAQQSAVSIGRLIPVQPRGGAERVH
ncbi:MAG: hypothetical protein M0003_10545 [Acidithiobacillus sp.]|nr:hypothetical protein [Acidithiobacillus sp.]